MENNNKNVAAITESELNELKAFIAGVQKQSMEENRFRPERLANMRANNKSARVNAYGFGV